MIVSENQSGKNETTTTTTMNQTEMNILPGIIFAWFLCCCVRNEMFSLNLSLFFSICGLQIVYGACSNCYHYFFFFFSFFYHFA